MTEFGKIFGGCVLMTLGLALACSSEPAGNESDDDDGGGGTSATGGTNGTGGASGTGGAGGAGVTGGSPGTGGSGPPITSAPPAWVRPADCGGIGNLCPNLSGCAALSTCQLEGNVCIPALEPGATMLPSRSAERPYCAAYSCMTFDQASCFCTGEAGAMYPDCLSPSALAGLCGGEGRTCNATLPCCSGLGCTSNGSYSTCKVPCATGSDCPSGCCTDLYDTGSLICADADACANPCKKRGDATCDPGSATMASDCCRGTCVQADNPDYAGCRPLCETNTDCDTGCCVPFSNGGGFCADALYCTCNPVGGVCGEGNPGCCDGADCASFDATNFACYPSCTQASDCATSCCVPFDDGTGAICLGPEYCPNL